MFPVSIWVVLVTAQRSPEYGLPIGAKWLIREMQIPARKLFPKQVNMSKKALGSNPVAAFAEKNIFWHEIFNWLEKKSLVILKTIIWQRYSNQRPFAFLPLFIDAVNWVAPSRDRHKWKADDGLTFSFILVATRRNVDNNVV